MSRKRVAKRKKAAVRKVAMRARSGIAPGVRVTKARGSGYHVRLKTPAGSFVIDIAAFEKHGSIAQEAMRWGYTLRSRSRWMDSEQDRALIAGSAADLLNRLGIETSQLEAIAAADMVEVEIPWSDDERDGWPLRVLPWEYLIAGATRTVRPSRTLTVMRHLRDPRVDETPQAKLAKAPRVLFVASEPGALRGYFDFETERDLVRSRLGADGERWRDLNTPSPAELRDAVETFRPDVIHLAGVDTHRAYSILLEADDLHGLAEIDNVLREGMRPPGDLSDGYLLGGDGICPVRGEDLGKLLTPAGHRPYFVAINIGNSAARIAPLVVAAGASAATGFQDNFDDDLAELFFSVFYTRLKSGLVVPEAFTAAWEKVRDQPASKQGTGTALWSAHPLIVSAEAVAHQHALARKLAHDEEKPIEPTDVAKADVGDYVSVHIVPIKDLNYSLLHNQRPLFDYFLIRSRKNLTLRDVRVKVSLFSGSETAVYDRRLDVVPPSTDIKRDIHVPLTSLLTRSVHESVRTSITVEVTWGEHLLYLDTSRVRLIPVDQWRDTEEDRKWLPSFVFPRDPAVTHLVDCAQRYMRVLRDDPNAGFEGYQSVNVRQPKTMQQVDLQVQALWSAIVYDLKLGYINPPPSYSQALDSQRLRTPTMIVRDHSGTCIDLALFFAACLEFVDIYPAIILLKDHAFPAYWRAERYHTEFRTPRPQNFDLVVSHDDKLATTAVVRAGAHTTSVANAQHDAWVINAGSYGEIVALVNDNRLVPIETVRLTEHCGFWEAVGAGRENLGDKRSFDSMIDIALAREMQITPLPIMGEQI